MKIDCPICNVFMTEAKDGSFACPVCDSLFLPSKQPATQQKLRAQTPEPDMRLTFLTKWLYHGSEHAETLSSANHLRAFACCDGYGKMTEAQLTAKGLSWDWSHVRDSSPEAMIAAEAFLRDLGCE